MPISRKKNWKAVNAALEKSVRSAVARSAVVLQAEIKAELSKPGTGRFYARHKRVRALAVRKHDELSMTQVVSLLQRENERVARSNLRGKPSKMRNLRSLGIHRASAPGQPPAVDTGHLRRSVQGDLSRLNERNPRARVGSNVKYAVGLEYGTRRVAKRPAWRVAARRARPKILQIFSLRGLLLHPSMQQFIGGKTT